MLQYTQLVMGFKEKKYFIEAELVVNSATCSSVCRGIGLPQKSLSALLTRRCNWDQEHLLRPLLQNWDSFLLGDSSEKSKLTMLHFAINFNFNLLLIWWTGSSCLFQYSVGIPAALSNTKISKFYGLHGLSIFWIASIVIHFVLQWIRMYLGHQVIFVLAGRFWYVQYTE